MGHATSRRMVAELLHELGYSLQANRKSFEGEEPHRTGTLNSSTSTAEVQAALKSGEPVISVDAKKKELIGELQGMPGGSGNAGGRARTWCGSMTSSSRNSAATRPTPGSL